MLALERTAHAAQRQQARATLPLWESLVLDYGTYVRSNGADLVCLDRAARKRIRHAVGGDRAMRMFDRWQHQYLIVGDDGCLITTGYRDRRIKRR